MLNRPNSDMDERRIEQALKEELDAVAPGRDLWPSVEDAVRGGQEKRRRRWLLPPFGWLTGPGGHVSAVRVTGTALGSVVALLIAGLVVLQPWQGQIGFGVGSPPPSAAATGTPVSPRPPAAVWAPSDPLFSARGRDAIARSSAQSQYEGLRSFLQSSGESGGVPFRVENRDPGGSGSYQFAPNEMTFDVGDTVTFALSAETEFHTFTVDGLGIDVTLNPGATEIFTFTFDKAGTFELICIPHEALGMVGTITVH